jgi:lysophospholipase L1-like esterase
VLTTRLIAHESTARTGVLNGGIGAGSLVAGGVSTPGLQRYKRDLFDHAGVKWVVLFIGVNDIGNSGCSMTTSNNVINAFTTIADSAHARGIKVYGATITPFNGNNYYSANSEACRQRINAWVRTTDKYDAVIDFERIVRNPADTTRILPAYNNDGLHPNIAGYAAMGNAIDTALFASATTGVRGSGSFAHGANGLSAQAAVYAGSARFRFVLPREAAVSLDLYSSQGRRVASLSTRRLGAGAHALELKTAHLPQGVYWYELKAGEMSATRRIMLKGR